MVRKAFQDPRVLWAYVGTKLAVFALAAIATWPLAKLIGPHAWIGLGVFGGVLAILTLAVIFGSSQTASSDVEAVKATLVDMWAAIEAGDVERYASYLHPEITVFGEGDVYRAEGKELEVRSIAEWVERASGVHTEMHQPRVVVRGDVAWITYYWTDSGIEDGERFTSRGKSTRIFVRENRRWLCIHGHFTAVP